MKEKLRILFTAICLLSTSVVTVATSKKRNNDLGYVYVNEITPESLAQRDYLVDSNCPQSIFQEQIFWPIICTLLEVIRKFDRRI